MPTHPGSRSRPSRGDPVDALTGGVFTIPVEDLRLAGPYPLSIERLYNTDFREKDVGLGPGWTFSLASEAVPTRRMVQIYQGTGGMLWFLMPEIGGSSGAEGGYTLCRTGESTFELLDEAGNREVFAAEGSDGSVRLTERRDRHGNSVKLTYEQDRLTHIQDSVGRSVAVTRTEHGQIRSFDVKNAWEDGRWVRFVEYRYDTEGRLAEAIDADGSSTRYEYDEDDFLVRTVNAVGCAFHYVYDKSGRCVETWGVSGPGGAEPSLSPRAPAVLADGKTKAKGFFHCRFDFTEDGYSQVSDSVSVQRFEATDSGQAGKIVHGAAVFTRIYDAEGAVLAHTDAAGATTSFTRDALGRETSITDPLGRTTYIERDVDGHVRRVIDPQGNETTVHRDARSLIWRDPIGAQYQVTTDDRGLTVQTVAPTGATTRFEYDDHGNLVRKIAHDGRTWTFEYDFWGRVRSQTLPDGGVMSFSYSPSGHLLRVTDAAGGVTRYEYNGVGDRIRVCYPDGPTAEYEYSGYHFLHKAIEPTGKTTRYTYDREGRLAEIHDGAGAVHSIDRNDRGMISRETCFDGRVLEYGYDVSGRLVRARCNGRLTAELEYDSAGQMISRTYEDDTTETFTYDELGRMDSATTPKARFTYEYNAVGWLVRETCEMAGEKTWVEADYNLVGRPVLLRTSEGHEVTFGRDAMGRATHIDLAPGKRIDIERDKAGREHLLRLPGGGLIEHRYDTLGRLSHTTARSLTARSTFPASQPDWIGPIPETASVARGTLYNGQSEPREVFDQLIGRQIYEHDASGQVLSRSVAGTLVEAYRYDAADNVHDALPGKEPRSYDPGNRLAADGDRRYVFRDDACLAEIRREGSDAAPMRFLWNGAGLLETIEMPDGRRIDMDYDPFARRIRKRTTHPGGDVSETRFLWYGDTIAHEIRTRISKGRDLVVEERRYVYDDAANVPVAQLEKTSNGEEWLHFITDELGAPQHLVSDTGDLVASPLPSLWGTVDDARGGKRTPLRFRGQYEDEETGFFYNRYRYYDPATGRYLSADPLGVFGGLNGFCYADNCPTTLVDPEGLMPKSTITQPGRPDIHGTSGNVPPIGNPGASPPSASPTKTRSSITPAATPVVPRSTPSTRWAARSAPISKRRGAGPVREAE
ncbi:MAG: RHS repeat-associated core domain-containing protein [Polyangiaceae bacterium]